MQCLRLAAFMNRPSLLAIETLVMMGPYLTNSGKFLDAWALFGLTIRLAQSIGRKYRILFLVVLLVLNLAPSLSPFPSSSWAADGCTPQPCAEGL